MGTRSIKKNTIYNIIKSCSSILYPLIAFPYISRVLLPDNVGKINFGLSIISFFSYIATLGISTYAIRVCSVVRDNKKKLGWIASELFSINIITTIVAYILLSLTLVFYNKLENYRTLIIIQSVYIGATTLGADWLNTVMEDFRFVTIRTVIFQLISLFLLFIFVRQEEDYMKYALISLISNSGASIANIWYRRRYCRIKFTAKIDWKKHTKPILYLFVMIIAQNIFNTIDSTMLGIMRGDWEVGIYSTAHRMSVIITQTVGSLFWVIMPRMSTYFSEGDYENINHLLRKMLGFNAILGVPCAVGCCVLAKDIILIIAGVEYIEAVPVLQILMVAFVINLFGSNFLGNAILLPSGKEKIYMIICWITAIVNVVSNYILIPYFGSIAAAGTTVFCALLIFVMLIIKRDKNIKIESIWKIFITPVVGCIFIVGICIVFANISTLFLRIILSISVSIIVYGLVMIIGKNELANDIIDGIKKKYFI